MCSTWVRGSDGSWDGNRFMNHLPQVQAQVVAVNMARAPASQVITGHLVDCVAGARDFYDDQFHRALGPSLDAVRLWLRVFRAVI